MNAWILVIEDNPLNRELVTDVLEASRFRVSHASTAEEGIQFAREFLPDLILMDISLPGMDGLAATRVLKADPATARLPVIALTAHAMRGDEAMAREAGCDGYLSKPVDTRKLPEMIDSFIRAALKERKADSASNLNKTNK